MSGSEQATLIILAGGESKRMGWPKHLLPTPWGTVLDLLYGHLSPLFVETLVVGRDLSWNRPGVRVVEDLLPLRCPLVGIYSGLCSSTTSLNFVVACDMPGVKPTLVQYLLGQATNVDAVVPMVRGYYEPLCAAYRKSALPALGEALALGERKVTQVYRCLRLRELPEEMVRELDPTLSSFVNLNTPRELSELARGGRMVVVQP